MEANQPKMLELSLSMLIMVSSIKKQQQSSFLGPDPDDDLDSGYTNADGTFELSGDTTELTTIDPHLKIYHDCNDGINVRTLSQSSYIQGVKKVEFRDFFMNFGPKIFFLKMTRIGVV